MSLLNPQVRTNFVAFPWKEPGKSLEVRFDFGPRQGFSKQLFGSSREGTELDRTCFKQFLFRSAQILFYLVSVLRLRAQPPGRQHASLWHLLTMRSASGRTVPSPATHLQQCKTSVAQIATPSCHTVGSSYALSPRNLHGPFIAHYHTSYFGTKFPRFHIEILVCRLFSSYFLLSA